MHETGERVGRTRPAGAWLWVFCAQFFVMEQVVRLGWRAPYSFRANYVSDLGAQLCGPGLCSPWHAWMNSSFLLEGALMVLGALRLWRTLGKGWVGKLGLLLVVVSGLGLMGVAFVPEDVSIVVHARAAVAYFLGGGFGVMLVGLGLLLRREIGVGGVSVVVGLAVLAATVTVGQMSKLPVHPDVGAVERVAVYGLTGWLIAVGWWVVRRTGEMRLEQGW